MGQQEPRSLPTPINVKFAIASDLPIKENLSAEDKEAREKGLQLVAHIEQLAQNDEGFRRWLQVGFDQITAGEFVTFNEDDWKEE